MLFRKSLWDRFYALVIADVFITHQIKSPTLQLHFKDIHGIKVYQSLVEDFSVFFLSSDLSYLIDFFTQVLTEEYSKEFAQEVLAEAQVTHSPAKILN